jgi:hypothetical protein
MLIGRIAGAIAVWHLLSASQIFGQRREEPVMIHCNAPITVIGLDIGATVRTTAAGRPAPAGPDLAGRARTPQTPIEGSWADLYAHGCARFDRVGFPLRPASRRPTPAALRECSRHLTQS